MRTLVAVMDEARVYIFERPTCRLLWQGPRGTDMRDLPLSLHVHLWIAKFLRRIVVVTEGP